MTKQGTQNNAPHRLASIEDLDELLAKHSLAPAVVKLGGKNYQIRTDLTAAETQLFIDLMGRELNAQAITLLVGTKAERDGLMKAVARSRAGETVELPVAKRAADLDTYLDKLPRVHVALVSGRIMRASRVLAQHTKDEADILAEYGLTLDEPGDDEEKQGESSAS